MVARIHVLLVASFAKYSRLSSCNLSTLDEVVPGSTGAVLGLPAEVVLVLLFSILCLIPPAKESILADIIKLIMGIPMDLHDSFHSGRGF